MYRAKEISFVDFVFQLLMTCGSSEITTKFLLVSLDRSWILVQRSRREKSKVRGRAYPRGWSGVSLEWLINRNVYKDKAVFVPHDTSKKQSVPPPQR